MRIGIEVSGDVQLSRELLRFSHNADDLRPAFEQITEDFYEIEKRQFDSEGGFASGGWPALSDTYAAWKAVHYPGKSILRRTDALYKSLTGGEGGVKKITRDSLELGTSVPHATFHQNAKPPRKRRRPVELRAQDRNNIVKTLQRHLTTGHPGSGLFGVDLP